MKTRHFREAINQLETLNFASFSKRSQRFRLKVGLKPQNLKPKLKVHPLTKNPFGTKASTSGCVSGLAYRCKSGVLIQSHTQSFWDEVPTHFWRTPADQRARGLYVRKLSTAYLVPVNALEKWVRLNLLTTTDFASHQSTNQITGGDREGTENGKKSKINCESNEVKV